MRFTFEPHDDTTRIGMYADTVVDQHILHLLRHGFVVDRLVYRNENNTNIEFKPRHAVVLQNIDTAQLRREIYELKKELRAERRKHAVSSSAPTPRREK